MPEFLTVIGLLVGAGWLVLVALWLVACVNDTWERLP